MSEEASESVAQDPNLVDAKTMEVIDLCMMAIDESCRNNSLDASAMIYMSVHLASHLMARGLFFAAGPEARVTLKNKMLDNVSEILDSARQHIDQSERELSQSQIIRPN